jgi:hypothetical protein
MSLDRYCQVVREMCEVVGLPDADTVLSRGAIEVENFEVVLAHYENDPGAMYINFNFGIASAGQTLNVYRLMLESNVTVYAQDQAQLGVDPEDGFIVLTVRAVLSDDVDGHWLASTFSHYAGHGRYWRDNILNAPDDAYEGLCAGEYHWIKI